MDLTSKELSIMQIFHRFGKLKVMQRCTDLNPGEAHVLLSICCGQDHAVPVSLLQERMEVPAPAISRLMKRMEEQGLIQREWDKKDRRNVIVSATEKGREEFRRISIRMKQVFAEFFSVYSEADVQRFYDRIMEALDRLEMILTNLEK